MKNKKFENFLSTYRISKGNKFWFIAPLTIILVAIILIVSLGATTGDYSGAVGIGIDFEGGTALNVTLGQDAETNYNKHSKDIVDTIEKHGVEVSYIQLQTPASVDQYSIAFRYKNISKDDTAINELNEKIIASIDALYPSISNQDTNFITYESIGATAASDLLSKAAIAVVVSTLLILIYIMFRFTLVSGIAAVLALLHDVIIMFALTVICRVEINTPFIAAMITIIAYSINNTIIIFDRCRETLRPLKGQKKIDYVTIGDMAVRDNMTRSIYTTMTTMVTIIFLAALGSESIRQFCVPIILGLLAGVYSSIFLATPMWSKMSVAFDGYKEKHNIKGIDFKSLVKSDEQNKEMDDALAEVNKQNVDGDGGQTVASKPKSKSKTNTIYKYSKKNTKFKKK